MRGWNAALAAAATLVAGAAAGGIDGPGVWNLVDGENPAISAQVEATAANGPYFVSLLATCGNGVSIFGFANEITRFRNEEDGFRIENDVKGLPAFMQIQAPGYLGRFEPTRADRCSLRVEVRQVDRGRARLDCQLGADGFGLTPFPTEEQIELIRGACAGQKGISIRNRLKRVKVILDGTAEEGTADAE